MQKDNRIPEPNTFPVFSQQFLLSPHLVLDHGNKSKKQLQDFITALAKRIQTQLTYQKNLTQCGKLLQKYIQPKSQKCLSYISSAFKVDTDQRGKQAKDLADSIKSQIIQPLIQSMKKFDKLIKFSQKNFKKLNKDFITLTDNFNKAKLNLKDNSTKIQQKLITKHIYKYTTQFNQQKKNRQITKIMQQIYQKMQYQKIYKTSATQLNQIIEVYQKQVKQMLDGLQLAERQQIKFQSDAIRKLIVCQVSMFKNIQYDLINISKQMQQMYAQNDIQIFKTQGIAIANEEQKEKDRQNEKDLTIRVVEIQKSLLANSLKNVQDDYYTWEFNFKKNKTLKKVIQLRKKQLNPAIIQTPVSVEESKAINNENQDKDDGKALSTKENSQQNNQLQTLWKHLPKQMFKPPANLKGICQKLASEEEYSDFLELSQIINGVWVKDLAFAGETKTKLTKIIQKNNFIRILSFLFIEQYRVQNQLILNWQNYLKVGDLSKTFIEVCQKYGDVFALKGLLPLFFIFNSTQQDKPKKLLYQHPSIAQCNIWKKTDYWLASIFQSTYQQMTSIVPQKGQTSSQTLLRQKNAIFSQLSSYCHYMLMLGNPSKNVRKNLGKYCRLYQMTQQQNQTLSKMISDTIKQIKAANSGSSNNIPASQNSTSPETNL